MSLALGFGEHGTSLWCGRSTSIPDAARLLRAGWKVAGLSPQAHEPDLLRRRRPRSPVDAPLWRDLVPLRRSVADELAWAVGFHPGHGGWVSLLLGTYFGIEDLIEVRPPDASVTRYPYVVIEWARRRSALCRWPRPWHPEPPLPSQRRGGSG